MGRVCGIVCACVLDVLRGCAGIFLFVLCGFRVVR